MGISLRGHHLICLHFFKGNAYSKDFRNYLSMLKKDIKNSEIKIIDGADDVCKKCVYLKEGLCSYGKDAEGEIKAMDKKAIELFGIKGKRARWKEIKEKIPVIFNEWAAYCRTCDWADDCRENEKWRKLMNPNAIHK